MRRLVPLTPRRRYFLKGDIVELPALLSAYATYPSVCAVQVSGLSELLFVRPIYRAGLA